MRSPALEDVESGAVGWARRAPLHPAPHAGTLCSEDHPADRRVAVTFSIRGSTWSYLNGELYEELYARLCDKLLSPCTG
jgi:hypothetical protein